MIPSSFRRGRTAAAVAVLALLAQLGLAQAGQAAETVSRAGALEAQVQADPWRLRFVDRSGRRVLSDAPGTGPVAAGTLGFRALGVWFHATRVLQQRQDGETYSATLATTDPLRRLRVRIAPDGAGVIAVSAELVGSTAGLEAMGGGFEAAPGERYLGFGERSNAVDQTGGVVENFVAEGPYQPEERPFIAPFIPPWAMRFERQDATYYPMPWLLSTAGYGVLVDGGDTSAFRLRSDDRNAWSVEVTGPPPTQPTTEPGPGPARLSLRVFAGPAPADALRRMSAATGRQPRAAPETLGPWYHTEPGFGDERAILDGLQRADVPVSVGQIFTQYLPCANHRRRRARQRARVRMLHERGVAATTYINPMMCTRHPQYPEAVRTGALSKDRTGQPYNYQFSVRRDTVGQFDFSAPAGRDLFGRLVAEAVTDGHDGWMEDYGEYSPLDARSADGTPGRVMHNLYPTRYHCAARDVTHTARLPLRYARSGWTGTARCAPVVWGGDPTTDWGYDGLASAVKNGLSMGLSGVSTWGSDIGGFFALGTRRVTPELLKRWIEFGAVSGVMRAQETGIAVPAKDRPRVFEPEIVPLWRRYAKFRTQLHPYLAAADAEYRRSGLPIMRHLALVAPRDSAAVTREDEYLFGDDLLAAPVIEPGQRERSAYLPAGAWIDFWRAIRFDERSGALRLRSAPRVLSGRRTVTVPAPLHELPLFLRAGAVLPLLPPDVETLAAHGSDPSIVHVRDRRTRMRLIAFPRGSSTSAFNARERLHSRESRRGWALTVRGARRRAYRLEASLATLRQPLRPCRLSVGRRPLPSTAWSYERSAKRLTVRFTTRSGTLHVERCGPGRRAAGAPALTG